METTLIQNISMKDFLSNIKAEAELTTHQAAKTIGHNNGRTNTFKIDTHSQEEADTLIL